MEFLVSTFMWGGLSGFMGVVLQIVSDEEKPKRSASERSWKELITGLLGAFLFALGVFLFGVGYGFYLGGTP